MTGPGWENGIRDRINRMTKMTDAAAALLPQEA